MQKPFIQVWTNRKETNESILCTQKYRHRKKKENDDSERKNAKVFYPSMYGRIERRENQDSKQKSHIRALGKRVKNIESDF